MTRKLTIAVIGASALLATAFTPTAALANSDAQGGPGDGTGTLTINADAGDTLKGRGLSLYRLSRYDSWQTKDDTATSVDPTSVDQATETWIKTALDKAGVTPGANDTSNAETLMRQTDANTLRKTAKALADTKPTTPTQTVTSDQATVTVTLPAGLYLLVDDQGQPVIISTTIGGKTQLNTQTIGSTNLKGTTARIDKQIQAADGTWKDTASVTAGQTANYRAIITLPNKLSYKSITLTDTGQGVAYTSGSLKATISEGADKGRDVTGLLGTPTEKDGGFTLTSSDELIQRYGNQQVTITYTATITDVAKAKQALNTVNYKFNPHPGDPTDPPTPGTDEVPVDTYDFDLKKISAASTGQQQITVQGAGFKIQNKTTGKWLSWHADTKTWSETDDETQASEQTTGADGVINYDGLGAGDYLIKETTVPAGYIQAIKPSLNVTITDEGKITITGADQAGLTTPLTDADLKADTDPAVTVKNLDSLTQLPQTGGMSLAIITIGGLSILCLAGAFGFKAWNITHGDKPATI